MPDSSIKADLVLQNANVITIDRQHPRARSVAVRDGRFAAIGNGDNLADLIGPDTEVLDIAGKTVLPGFIDAHIHVLTSGIRHVMAADCALPSIRDVQAALRQQTAGVPAGQWVQGFKYDDTKTEENRFLNRHDLDAVSTDHPILVAHRAGHVYYTNSLGLERAGFTRDTPDPHGGRFGRDESTGELNGMMYERAVEPITYNHLPVVTPDIRMQGLRRICRMLNEVGLTSVHDAKVSNIELETYQQGHQNGDLTLRAYLLMYHDHFEALRDAGVRSGFGDDRLRIGGIKMVADGAIAARTAYLSEPYVGSPCDHGILAMSADEIEERVMQVHGAGFQVCIHANGDSAIDAVLSAYQKAQEAHPRQDPRHRLEHCTVVNPDLLGRIKALGCVATPFCTYIYYHGEKMPFYGESRVEWMFAQRSFLDYGINATGATDYPPGPYEPLLGIQSCVTRTDSTGRVWGANQAVSVEEALRIYTLHGAYASFEEDTKGSIEVGKLADMVVLDQDPTQIDPMTIKDIPVLRTVVGGKTVYEA